MDITKLDGGYIFDIQGFSVHDGPGCRTLIFLKGCPLRCLWCSNPEGIRPLPEPLYKESKCIIDLFCVQACPHTGIQLIGDKEHPALNFSREICNTCDSFDCVSACLTGALAKGGYFISLKDLYSRLDRDRQYWGEKGGITLTGGEPFAQPEFSSAILKKCYEAYIHTAVETCGNVHWENIELSLPWLEWIFFDLKHMDETSHQRLTSSSNKLILENAKRLAGNFEGRMIFRMPLVPGMNDSDENIRATSEFILGLDRKELNILPVHHLGREKYLVSGIPYRMPNLEMADRQRLLEVQQRFTSYGVQCYLGSETPF